MMDHLWTPWRMPYLKGDTSTSGPGCIFCHKVSTQDDTAEHIIHRGTYCYITMNLYPYNNGHLLIVPNQHTGALEALDGAAALELVELTQKSLVMLRRTFSPQGFNIGINQGAAAGAGVAAHLHQHIVPRWSGDTNYMTVVAATRVIPEWVDDTYRTLKQVWDELYP